MSPRLAGRVGKVLGIICLVNFAVFFTHSMAQGGSAGTGKREGGRYFVGSGGRYREVSEERWRVMRAHEYSVFVTHPLFLLVGAPLLIYARRTEPGRPAVDRGL